MPKAKLSSLLKELRKVQAALDEFQCPNGEQDHELMQGTILRRRAGLAWPTQAEKFPTPGGLIHPKGGEVGTIYRFSATSPKDTPTLDGTQMAYLTEKGNQVIVQGNDPSFKGVYLLAKELPGDFWQLIRKSSSPDKPKIYWYLFKTGRNLAASIDLPL